MASMELDIAANKLEALGNPTRLAVYRVLVQAGSAGTPVGEVQKRLQVPSSTLSHHIAKLVQAGLITQRRESRTLYCSADYTMMQSLIEFLLEKCCADEAQCCEETAGETL